MAYWHRPGLPFRPSNLLQVVNGGHQYQLSILHAGTNTRRPEDVQPKWVFRQHMHDIYHVVLYLEGESSFYLNNRTERCGPGTLVLVGPGEQHEFYFCAKNYVKYVDIGFSLDSEDERRSLSIPFHELLKYYAGDEFVPKRFPIQLNQRQTVDLCGVLGTTTERLIQGSEANRFSIVRQMYRIIEFLIDEVYSVHKVSVSPEYMALLKVREEIERRYFERMSLEELAGIANLSVGYLVRAFKARFKTTPMAYQRELRVRAAKNLLLTTSYMCKEIADRVGYSDMYLFSKNFHRLAGVSPTEFRELTNKTKGKQPVLDSPDD